MASFLNNLAYLEVALCVAALCFLVFKRRWRDYWALGSFLAVRVVSSVWMWSLIRAAGHSISKRILYETYFYVYWVTFAIESVLALMILFSLYRATMTPLRGLQKLGLMALGSVVIVSVLLAFGSAVAPNIVGVNHLITPISQMQRTQSLMTLGLMVFLCFAIRPMGLSYRSSIFGVGVGLGLLAINDLVQSAWLAHSPQMRVMGDLANGIVLCVVVAMWVAYFAMREPERREVFLPGSSRLVRLDRMALGWVGE